ncbi:hypothetical protein [Tellurirhabdus rosea]|nr:hypothetical protein [Tellurirhabdus rosea]
MQQLENLATDLLNWLQGLWQQNGSPDYALQPIPVKNIAGIPYLP